MISANSDVTTAKSRFMRTMLVNIIYELKNIAAHCLPTTTHSHHYHCHGKAYQHVNKCMREPFVVQRHEDIWMVGCSEAYEEVP